MSRKTFFLLSGCSLFLLFVIFSYFVHRNIFQAVDFDMTVRLQDHLSRRFDIPFSYLSLIGEFQYVAIVLAIILFFRRKIISGLSIFFFFGVIHIFELYGKIFVNHKPPPHFLLRTNIPVNLPQFYVSTQNSYPSGHASRAFFITTVLFLFVYFSKKKFFKMHRILIFFLLFLYDVIMCMSRVYLGEHWLSDIVGGSMIGLGFGLLSGVFL